METADGSHQSKTAESEPREPGPERLLLWVFLVLVVAGAAALLVILVK